MVRKTAEIMGQAGGATTFRRVCENIVLCSSGFGNLINTACWLFGIGFTISGCVKLYKVFKYCQDEPDFVLLRRRALRKIFLGFACLVFPFLQQAMRGHPYYNVSCLGRRYITSPDITQVEDNLKLLVIICWFLGALGFFSGSLALARSHKVKDGAANARLKDQAAIGLLSGFFLTPLPLACALLMGVQLWYP